MLLSPFGLWLAARVDNRSLAVLFSIVLAVIAPGSASRVVSGIAAGRLEWAAAIPFCAGGAHVQRAFAAVAALVAAGMVARAALSLPS